MPRMVALGLYAPFLEVWRDATAVRPLARRFCVVALEQLAPSSSTGASGCLEQAEMAFVEKCLNLPPKGSPYKVGVGGHLAPLPPVLREQTFYARSRIVLSGNGI